jgi:Bacterial Ig-like domain
LRRLIFCALLCACASQGVPPGGPEDVAAPKILSITPDTGQTSVKTGQAVFKFDEVVAERPPGAVSLADLVVISPRRGTSDVSWGRNELRIKPSGGWRANTTYTVTLLPGVADLRGNVRNTAASTFFSTGPTLARARISGTVIDWLSATTVRGALVEARAPTDTTLSWVSVTDSVGVYSMGHVPAGQYTLRAYLDKNHDLAINSDEARDTTSISLVDSGAAQLLIFVPDSIAPSIDQISATDSVTLIITFDRPADSVSAMNPANYSITGPDSSRYPGVSVRPPPKDTSQHTVPMARPGPLKSVILTLGRQLSARVAYRVRATGIRGVSGKSAPSEKTLNFSRFTPVTLPKRIPPPPRTLPGGAVPIPPPGTVPIAPRAER